MGTLSQILQAHGDPVKVAAILGRSTGTGTSAGPAVAPGAAAPLTPFVVADVRPPFTAAAPVAINVDRPAAVAPAATGSMAPTAIAPGTSLIPAAQPTLPAASWLDWVKGHWPWLLAALLALLIIAYAGRGSGRKPAPSGFRPSRMVKGSPEARAHMANLRARKGR